MREVFQVLVVCLISSVVLVRAQTPAPTLPVLSATSSDMNERLVVAGDNKEVRSRVLSIAKDLRADLYDLIALPENSQKHQLLIKLYGREGDSAPPTLYKKGFSVYGDGLQLRLDLHLAKGVEQDKLQEVLAELFIFELGLREQNVNRMASERLKIFPWLYTGMIEAQKWKKERVDRALYARLFDQDAIFPVDVLLQETSLSNDALILDHVFRVSSGALVMALLNQPEGKDGLRRLMMEAPTFDGEQKLLISKYFPATTLSKNSLAKWWSLQLASMSERPAEQLYSIEETEKALSDALVVKVKDMKGAVHFFDESNYLSLRDFPEIIISTPVARVVNELSLVQSKAFPSYRPLIGAYQEILLKVVDKPGAKTFSSLFKRKETDLSAVEETLAGLKAEREILRKLGERVGDYLNWFELEEADSQGGEFADYLQIKKELEAPQGHDGGPISRYLEDIEKLYRR